MLEKLTLVIRQPKANHMEPYKNKEYLNNLCEAQLQSLIPIILETA